MIFFCTQYERWYAFISLFEQQTTVICLHLGVCLLNVTYFSVVDCQKHFNTLDHLSLFTFDIHTLESYTTLLDSMCSSMLPCVFIFMGGFLAYGL